MPAGAACQKGTKMTEYILPIIIFLAFGALAGVLLLIASKLLAVKTDETA